jgi:hypothetical protein
MFTCYTSQSCAAKTEIFDFIWYISDSLVCCWRWSAFDKKLISWQQNYPGTCDCW